jgi:hypothetical protein
VRAGVHRLSPPNPAPFHSNTKFLFSRIYVIYVL